MCRHFVIASMVVFGLFVSGAWAGEAPKVVKTVPASGADDVSPGLDRIVVTFDTPIKQNSHSLVVLGELKFPELAGDEPISFPDDKTCVIKVKLEPDTAYGLGLNSATRTGFKSAEDGTAATPFELRFKTAAIDKAGAVRVPVEEKGPHVVKTDPPNGAVDLDAGTFDLTIVFSEPMKKGQASIITPPDGPRLKPIGKPRWEDARTFVAPVMLDAGKNYRLGINVIEPKRFVTAGDDTPADPFELTFSTKGAPGVVKGKAGPASGPAGKSGGEARLRYDYRKGDAGRTIRKSTLDIKLNVSNGQTISLGDKTGLNAIEEVLVVEKNQPMEVRKLISEYVAIQMNPETGQPEAAPRLDGPVAVRLDRRADPPEVKVEQGEVPEELKELLAQDTFVDLLPTGVIKVGQSYDLPAATLEEVKRSFDASGEGQCRIKLIAQRIGPLEVDDARNEMYRAKGGGSPVTYVFDVVEFGLDWKQDGQLQGQIPFTMEATGKVVFAIEAGILLTTDVDAKITIKQVGTQDENGQPITVSGGGTYMFHNKFEPINWTRGAKRKGDRAVAASGPDRTQALGESCGDKESMGTPKGSIAYQFDLLKKGDVEALKACFTEDVRDRITAEAVKTGQENAKDVTLEDLVGEVIESEGLGSSKSVKIKMKNGRTLTTLVSKNGKWLAETVWFK